MAAMFFAWWFGFWVFIAYSVRSQHDDGWQRDLAAVITAVIWPVAIVWGACRNGNGK